MTTRSFSSANRVSGHLNDFVELHHIPDWVASPLRKRWVSWNPVGAAVARIEVGAVRGRAKARDVARGAKVFNMTVSAGVESRMAPSRETNETRRERGIGRVESSD
jgi:hypothetical protein